MTRRMRTKFNSKCRECGIRLPKGTMVVWYGRGKGVSCTGCHGGTARENREYREGVAAGNRFSAMGFYCKPPATRKTVNAGPQPPPAPLRPLL